MLEKSRSRSVPLHPSEHHPTLYFHDGNVVLAAFVVSGSTQRFRVHQSYLSQQSPVFADMFSLPSPSTGTVEEIYDGVPLVHMPDSAEDVASLLRAIYSPLFLPTKRRDPKTPLLLRGALKLAKKYQFHMLRDHIIEHVKSQWPHTLAEWDSYQEELKVIRDSPQGVDYKNGPWLEPVSAIHLGEEFYCQRIVHTAFYHLSTLPHDSPGVRWDLMEHKDWIALLRAQQSIWTNAQFAEYVESDACGDLCGAVCKRALKLAARNNKAYLAVPPNCLSFALDVYNQVALASAGMCHECIPDIMEIADNHRNDRWEIIGEWIDLDFDLEGGWCPIEKRS